MDQAMAATATVTEVELEETASVSRAVNPAIPGERGRDLARGDNRSQQCWRFVSQ